MSVLSPVGEEKAWDVIMTESLLSSSVGALMLSTARAWDFHDRRQLSELPFCSLLTCP